MEIQFRKTNLIIACLGSLIFVGIGIWLAFGINHPTFLQILVGVLSMLFFGLTGAISIGKLLDTRPGLIINDQGIQDNSSGVAGGFLAWEQIVGIETKQVKGQSFVQIFLKDPEQYLAQAKGWRKQLQKLNYEWYGTPINISANSLIISHSELRHILTTHLKAYQQKQSIEAKSRQ
jgi:hypothetical protein